MKNKLLSRLFYTFRWRMVGYMMLSAIISIAASVVFVVIILLVRRVWDWLDSAVRVIYNTMGAVLPTVLLIILLTIVLFFYFCTGAIRYINEISRSVNRIAKGDLAITVPIKSHDEFGELAQNINDMTEQLRRSAIQQREAEQTKSELITSVAHDLRTPLTSIIGYLQLINDEPGLSQETIRRYVSIAYNKSRSLERLIEDLFDYTRFGNSEIGIRHNIIDMCGLLTQLADECYPLFQNAGMKCVLHLDDPILISGDGDLLARVFDNLFNNAIKYGEGKDCDVYAQKQNGKAVFRVVSHGKEIPKDKLDRIFDRFYRVEQSRSSKYGGTGLGLPIARSIIHLHGGSINVTSENGETAFIVELPC
ncbi:MAG: HAMP domain-containing histidine kinase [Clostridia bacterium]|nr:HAMP domain-containing histidine kinase [Clostridia bacterium]